MMKNISRINTFYRYYYFFLANKKIYITNAKRHVYNLCQRGKR